MPHPAIYELRAEYVPIKTSHCWATDPSWPAGGAWSYHNQLKSYVYREEPASTSNPIRPDGTRAPSPYFIKTLVFSQKSSLIHSTASDPGYWGWANGPAASPANIWQAYLAPVDPVGTFLRLHPANNRVKVDSLARTRFLNKLADASGKDSWELGIVAGEFRETCGMAASLAGSLVSSARSIARATRQKPELVADTLRLYGEHGPKAALRNLGGRDTALLEAIVQGWLVKQFGIDPLVNDLFNASVQLNASFADPVRGAESFVTTIRGGAEDTFVWTDRINPAFTEGIEGVTSYMDLQEVVRYAFSARYAIPVKPTVNQRLGLYNPVHLAAQLTRFSWMADYVTNLSSWLRACMAGQDCRFIEGTRSFVCRTTVQRGYSEANPGLSVLRDPARSFVLSSDWFDREVLPIVGVMPSFLPSVKNQLNATKLANSIAALTTLVGARSRPGPPVINY